MVEAAVVGALAFAASAGVATFFAPCAFPLLPGYVGYYLSESDRDTGMLAPAVAAAGGALGALGVVALLVLAVGSASEDCAPGTRTGCRGWANRLRHRDAPEPGARTSRPASRTIGVSNRIRCVRCRVCRRRSGLCGATLVRRGDPGARNACPLECPGTGSVCTRGDAPTCRSDIARWRRGRLLAHPGQVFETRPTGCSRGDDTGRRWAGLPCSVRTRCAVTRR